MRYNTCLWEMVGMKQYRIRGETRLTGELCVGGAKNATLPILAAVCLNESESIIHNCPRIADTFVSIEILEAIGCKVKFVGNTLTVDSSGVFTHEIPDDSAKKMRSSILFMGAMLGVKQKVNIALPGGCRLGERAIDLHISGLRAMGATIHEHENKLICSARKLRGAKIRLNMASVGATENLMIAAVKAKGETIIENAAREPEILDLARFLIGMGAEIKGAGTGTIIIKGVKKLKSTSHYIMPDRIVAGTYLVACAMTEGQIKLKNVSTSDLIPITSRLIGMGCKISTTENDITLVAPPRLLAVPRLITKIHPGFPTDMQAQFVAALATANGRSLVTETIFDSRYLHAEEINRMGGDIVVSSDKQTFDIQGKEQLIGTTVTSHDLRGGAALILAGLFAQGETIVKNAEYVERGYENIVDNLTRLGADIQLEIV